MKNNRSKFYLGDIPVRPGVYIFRDIFGKVIYVGKAINLRHRMSQYFHPSKIKNAEPKQRSLINSISSWDYIPVKNETESLLLESNLIKKYTPFYNILMQDDKRYSIIKINPNDPFPILSLTRLRKNDGAKYFGPFPNGSAVKQMLEFFTKYFNLRFCQCRIPMETDRKHCMEARVKYCCEPCIGKITQQDYRKKVDLLMQLLNGNIGDIINNLTGKMQGFANTKQFEKAAEIRDVITNIKETFGKKSRNFRFATISYNTNASEVLKSLQSALSLSTFPKIIESFDISNFGEQFAVGSMICFVNGIPEKGKYRRFKIKTIQGIDDFGMIREIIFRRYKRIIDEKKQLPDLIIIDGGKGQLSAGLKALLELKIRNINVISIAKKNEEIFAIEQDRPIILERHSPALKLIQSIRDEAHRFAISYNRELRMKRIQESILDDIPGIGKKRKLALLTAFDSISELKKNTAKEICLKVNNIGLQLAQQILEVLNKK